VHLTNTATDEVSQEVAKRLGADAYLTHPVDAERLCVLLRSLRRRNPKRPE
jgi:DNA-binding response OmpR family regulator